MKKKSIFKQVLSVVYNVLLFGLGLIAIFAPAVFSQYVGLIAGAFLTAVAICMILIAVISFSVSFGGYFLLIGGLLCLGAGMFFMFYPGVGLSIVTIVLGFIFFFNGVSKLTLSLQQRRFHLSSYIYNMVFGIFYIVLSLFMFFFTIFT